MRVVQLSDIHWGAGPSPIDGREPATCFGHVVDALRAGFGTPDLFVATGDLTDDGSDAAAAELAHALTGLGAPVHCLAGNHDSGRTLDVLTATRPALQAPRATRHGNWLFCYVDTNARGVVDGPHGREDHPDRMHRAASLAIRPDDLAALEADLEGTDAEHVMVWVHHPPLLPPALDRPAARGPAFAELHARLARHGTVRAVAAGHLHNGYETPHEGIRYLGAPTTWLGMDFDRRMLTAPGYRTFVFHDDGTIDTEVVLVENPDYPDGRPLPDWVAKVFAEHFGVPLEPRG